MTHTIRAPQKVPMVRPSTKMKVATSASPPDGKLDCVVFRSYDGNAWQNDSGVVRLGEHRPALESPRGKPALLEVLPPISGHLQQPRFSPCRHHRHHLDGHLVRKVVVHLG